jgi:radical SAM/Cys-rich protein
MKQDKFRERIAQIDLQMLHLQELTTLQVNLGNRCNQRCAHCHVEAGPHGRKVMLPTVMEKIFDFLAGHNGLCIDVTGGCPELNPDFAFFVERVHRLCSRLMVRTNLTVFFESGLEWVPAWYSEHGVVLVASLPCYTPQNVDAQRGAGVFARSIEAIHVLNALGYGRGRGLELNLVHNPGTDALPAPQQELEADYKRRLRSEYSIEFDKLFTMTNAPIGRFRRYLAENGQLEKYLQLLAENFNVAAAEGIMCRSLLSVDYRGVLYNCDFNQAINMPIHDKCGRPVTIEQFDEVLAGGIDIVTGDHCFCCTAGAGSSCTGSLVD